MLRPLKIDKNVPLPEPHTCGRERVVRIPWQDMEVGDSVFVPEAVAAGVKSNASQVSKRCRMRFTTRKVSDGVRVWRTE